MTQKTTQNPWTMDVRVRERNLKSGALTEKDLEKQLAALPDVAEQSEPFGIPQPALTDQPQHVVAAVVPPPPPVAVAAGSVSSVEEAAPAAYAEEAADDDDDDDDDEGEGASDDAIASNEAGGLGSEDSGVAGDVDIPPGGEGT